ncbi:hypothetical protein IV498_18160 [Paenarthrobacter sp. Z7-10]|nr:hypothetical protein [Paenarthrobacter sp. Z7-10]
MRRVRVAAADLESVEFERDSAELTLQQDVSLAVAEGHSLADVAEASNLTVREVDVLTGTIPVLALLDDRQQL